MGITPSLAPPPPGHQLLYFKGISRGSSSPAFSTVPWSSFLLTGVQLPSKPQKPEDLGCGGWRFTLCHRVLKVPLVDAFLEHVEN